MTKLVKRKGLNSNSNYFIKHGAFKKIYKQ